MVAPNVAESFPKSESPQARVVTGRAVISGLLLIIASDYYINWSTVILQASKNNKELFPMGLFFPFVALVAINLVLSRVRPQWTLEQGELCVALGMGLIGAVFPFYGLASYLIGTIVAPSYFASPENSWSDLLYPHMASWLVLDNSEGAVTWFYEGLPPGQAIPWRPWMVPLFWWMTMVFAAATVGSCLMVILRKQWVENERLEYPLMAVGMEVAMLDKAQENRPPFLKSRGFWFAFWIGLFSVVWNIVSYFFPLMPGIPTAFTSGHNFEWLTGARPIWVQLNIYVLGFGYFARIETLFSFWLFFFFTEIEVAIFDRLGVAASHGGGDAVRSQNFGVLCAYVVIGLWMARTHLKVVIRKILNREADEADESDEMMSYRAAAIGLVVGVLYMIAWLHAAGMEFRVLGLYLFFTLAAYVGMARFVAELGLPYGDISYDSITWTPMYILGAQTVSPSTLTAQAYLWSLFGKTRGFMGPPVAHALKLTSPFRFNHHRLAATIGLAIVFGSLLAVLHTVYMGYSSGSFNLRAAWNLLIGPQVAYNSSVSWIRNPEPPDVERMIFMGSGALITVILTYLRYRFVHLPIHPVALMLQSGGMPSKVVLSVFLTWVYKFTILKIGGVQLYRKGQPFFIGLLIGYALGVFLSCVMDSLYFYGRGHLVHGF